MLVGLLGFLLDVAIWLAVVVGPFVVLLDEECGRCGAGYGGKASWT